MHGEDDQARPSEQHDLAELFTRLGRELSAQRSLEDTLATITRRAVEAIPSAEHAAISRSRNGTDFETVAQTSEVPVRVDRIQYRLDSGPCLASARDNTVYRCDELADDPRWPEFGRLAVEQENIHSMLSVPLVLESDQRAAGLNLYSSQSHAFGLPDRTMATLLATHGALAIDAAQHRRQVDNLERALETSRQIGMAMGILMATHKVTDDQAFGLLRVASQSSHRKLSALAAEVTQTGSLELPPLPHRERSGGSRTS